MKNILFIVLLFVIVLNVSSEVEIGISAGYGIPVGGVQDAWLLLPDRGYTAVVDSNGKYNYSEYKDIYPSLGKGLKVVLDLTLFINDNFGVYIGTNFSTFAKYNFEKNLTFDNPANNAGFKKTIITYDINGSFIAINFGLNLKAKVGKVSPYFLIAPGIYLPIKVDVLSESKNDNEESFVKNIEIKYAPGFGIATALGLKINFSKVIGIRIECAPTYAFVRVKKSIHTNGSDDDPNKYVKIYEKNEATIPSNTAYTYYEHGGPKHSFSSIDAKIGIVFSF